MPKVAGRLTYESSRIGGTPDLDQEKSQINRSTVLLLNDYV